MGCRRLAVTLLLFFSTGTLVAQNSVHDPVQWHGFLTQGYIKTSDNNFFGDSENGSFEFTEIGLSASYRATENLLLAGQVLSRNAGDMYDAFPASIDFALADFMLHNSESGKTGVRVGRTKNTLGLYNETRDVAFTRPGIFVPQVIYFDKVRNLVLSSDGFIFYHDFFTESGNFSLTAGGGETVVDTNVEIAYLSENKPGKLEPDGLTWLLSGFYTTADDSLKLGLSSATSSMVYNPGSGDSLLAGTTDFKYTIASVQYNKEKWSVSSEFMQEPIRWKQYGPFSSDRKLTAEAYYLQGTFRFRPRLEFLLRYEEGFADKNDKSGQKTSTLTAGAVPAFSLFSKIVTTGLRWDVTPSIMLRAELQFHEGTFILSARENENQADLDKDWNLFSVLASYRF